MRVFIMNRNATMISNDKSERRVFILMTSAICCLFLKHSTVCSQSTRQRYTRFIVAALSCLLERYDIASIVKR